MLGGAGARVFAIEPIPSTFAWLTRNIAVNGLGDRVQGSDAAVFSAIAEAGFAPYRYEPFCRRLQPLEGPNRDGGNTLFLRDLPFVERRVKGAPTVDVRGVAL